MFRIRDVQDGDLTQMLEIYSWYVRHTAITFECALPSPEDFRQRIRRVRERYPCLVAVEDGRVAGFAYAGPFHPREAYDWCSELTIYLRPGAAGHGLGRALYGALEDALRRMGIVNLYACIGVPEEDDAYLTRNSADFHAHLGFRTVGVFRNCGMKFNRWYHMIWMEKCIGDHLPCQPPVKSYPSLAAERAYPSPSPERKQKQEATDGDAVFQGIQPGPGA